VWINNCVGKNNYTSFIVMIAATLTYIVLFVAAVAVVWRQHLW
jgi:hypothetical protein